MKIKKMAWNVLAALGWILFLVYLASAYFMNHYSNSNNTSSFSPITWRQQIVVVDGALSCSLLPDELQARLDFLKQELFPKITHKQRLENGMVYFFEDEKNTATQIMEFIVAEKQCCPFFQFDFSVLPFEQGLALKISGGKGILDFMEEIGF